MDLRLSSTVFAQSGSRSVEGALDVSWRYRYTAFQMLLEERGLSVIRDSARATRTPRQSVIVLFGDADMVSLSEWRRLRIFVDQGGALLVASERSFTLPGVTTFRSGPVSSNQPSDRYQGHADCLGLTDLDADHPVTKGLREIIINRSGWLGTILDSSLDWRTLARLPGDCLPFQARKMPLLIAGTQPISKGVFIISADQSLFSDGMLWHGDNALLSIQLVDQLCQGDRHYLTIINNGITSASSKQAQQPPAMPPLPPPLPPVPPELPEPTFETLLSEANYGLDAIQKDNLLNEALADRPRNMRPIAWVRTLLLLLGIASACYVLWKLLQRKSFTVPISHFRFMQSMFGVSSARQMENSDFSGAVEILAREFCRNVSQSPDSADWVLLLSGGHGSLMSILSRRQRKMLTSIVQLATKGCREHFSNRRFQAFGRSLVEIRAIHKSRFQKMLNPESAAI
ncbi:MAG: DUF4350 domain-containing protein [Planctomycetota bacterium]